MANAHRASILAADAGDKRRAWAMASGLERSNHAMIIGPRAHEMINPASVWRPPPPRSRLSFTYLSAACRLRSRANHFGGALVMAEANKLIAKHDGRFQCNHILAW